MSSESTNPGHHGFTPSSPPTMEPSHPSVADSVHPSLLIDAIASVREMYENIDPVEQIDPLITFVDNYLQKMNTPSEAGSRSSEEGWLATVQDSTKLAGKIIDTIFTEAEKLSNWDDAVKALGSLILTATKQMGDSYWVFIGLAVAAYAVERYLNVGSTEKECRGLLLKIVELAKGVKEYSKLISDEKEDLCNAVATIMEGAVILCDFLGKICRFCSPTTATNQLEKTKQKLGNETKILGLFVGLQCPKLSTMPLDIQQRSDYEGDCDVFLIYSAEQKKFVQQLHRDLTREHVSCFFDEDPNSLPLTEKFPSLILKPAETCKIVVVFLSKQFLCSKSMIALSYFICAMKTGKKTNLKLLPIFMDSRNELFHITKNYPKWKMLEEREVKSGECEDALRTVRTIAGLQFGEDGNELKFRDIVVKNICCILRQINPPKILEFEPVGIEEQVQEVKALLDMEGAQTALAVIIYGFGGVGKSTVAASVVQSLDCSWWDFCMVSIDYKTGDKTAHIINLQKYIISKLGGVEHNFQHPAEGRSKIKEVLKNRCSLLLIDNVVDKDYIRELLPQDLQSDKPETKLRMIITSREKHVKSELNIICYDYEVKSLSDADSERLLVDTIVQNQKIEVDERHMINEVAVACRGVPLLLSVFGKHLRGERNKYSYREALDVLREGNLDTYRDEDLGTRLMFVYYKIIDVEVKDAFLDICTFFHGWKWDLVADIVDLVNLEDLRRRMLVSKGGSDEVIVHDILRLMGMKEARQTMTRFSNYKELSIALEDDLDLGKVKGMSLDNDNFLITIKSTQLEDMHKSLRVLMLEDWVTVDGPPCSRAFRNLRYLRVGDITAFPFIDLSKLKNLRVFQNRSKPGMNLSKLPSSLKRIYHEVPHGCLEFSELPFENLSSLKSLRVQRQVGKEGKTQTSLVKLPKELHFPESLVDLDLTGCKNLPKAIGHLTVLESLSLVKSDLKCLPQGFGKLKKLKLLSMNYFSELVSLSEEVGMLSSLEYLRLVSLPRLQRIPDSFGQLKRLRFLFIEECLQLKTLSHNFENMATLEQLRIRKCPKLEGAMMEKILRLPNCSMADIEGSMKLVEKWDQMQSKTEYPIAVFTGRYLIDREAEKRAIMVALLNEKCLEVNNTTLQLMERSSLLVGLEKGTSATVALVILPMQVQSHQHWGLQRFVEMARERANTNGTGMLQIVCARKYVWTDEWPSPTEEEGRAELDNIRQLLLFMPKGSCALSKRVKMLTEYRRPDAYPGRPHALSFFVGHVVVGMEGRKSFENFEVVEEYDNIENCWDADWRDGQSSVARQSKTRKFKGYRIDHYDIEGRQDAVEEMGSATFKGGKFFRFWWDDLPEQLRERILSRLPMKSVFCLRSVSREWKSILTSNSFLQQWAFESAQNPWLMLWTANTQMPYFVYSFDLQSWQTLSLSFLEEKCRVRYRGSTSGLLLLDIRANSSSGNSRPRFCVCNPFSRTFCNLPDIPHTVTTVIARGIAGRDGCKGYEVIMLGKSRRNTVELHLYDSAVRSWRIVPSALPETLAVRNEQMVLCDRKFFCLGSEPPGILVFDVHAVDVVDILTVLPMPKGSNIFSRLLTCGGSLLVAGAREEDDVVKDVIIWQYCCPTWREIARMSRSLCEEFQRTAFSKWTWFECVGVGDNVCFRAEGSLEVVVYSTTTESWTWLPTCPATYEDREYMLLKCLPFQPTPDMVV